MPKTCLINYASGAWYPRGQERLQRSLVDVHFAELGDTHIFKSEAELGCPSHQFIPYGFKIAAFQTVANLGYKLILWCDAAVWAIKPLGPLFRHIEEHGYIFFAGGWSCAQWTSDACLARMQVSRDQAVEMPMYMACCMGLNLDHPRSKRFLDALAGFAWDGISFKGDWTNQNHQVSNDPRCLGHRHDQAVGSILAAQMGMEHTIGHETFFSYYNNAAKKAYVYGEPNDMAGIKESVVMLSQGM